MGVLFSVVVVFCCELIYIIHLELREQSIIDLFISINMSGNTSCCCFICVREMDAGVIENCGKFSRVATAGFSCLTCPFETVRGVVSLQVVKLTSFLDRT